MIVEENRKNGKTIFWYPSLVNLRPDKDSQIYPLKKDSAAFASMEDALGGATSIEERMLWKQPIF